MHVSGFLGSIERKDRHRKEEGETDTEKRKEEQTPKVETENNNECLNSGIYQCNNGYHAQYRYYLSFVATAIFKQQHE